MMSGGVELGEAWMDSIGWTLEGWGWSWAEVVLWKSLGEPIVFLALNLQVKAGCLAISWLSHSDDDWMIT